MKPGNPPSWGSGAKSAVGTAATRESCVWFTLARGCITETFYPRPDLAHTRCLFLTVTTPDGFFSDERLDTIQTVRMPEPGVPLFEVVNRCRNDRYSITKTVATDPARNVLIQRIRFERISPHDIFRLWVFLAPALGNEAYGNDASIDPAHTALVASRQQFAMALTASCGFVQAGCFYQGPRDLWNRLKNNEPIADFPDHAGDGNVLLAGEVDLRNGDGDLLLALGFAESRHDAIRAASESAASDFEEMAGTYIDGWREYRRHCATFPLSSAAHVYEASVAALKIHQSKEAAAGIVASLGVPWGETEQQILDFRYQLCWTRDAVEIGTALIAMGDADSAKSAWQFLASTQDEDGHWAQNMWLDGRPHWNGIQMDETALPILLADMLRRHYLLPPADAWPSVRRAAAYLVQNGPGTQQDRWENDGGYSPYTLAVEIAALLAAAEFADLVAEASIAAYFRAVADWWNDRIEEWTFIDGHYVRLSSPEKNRSGEIRRMFVKKREHSLSAAALALVRFGLRAAADPRILQTVADLDRHLKSETATGPVWHRYPDDHYGEYDDGRPFDGHGVGRGWPLLGGERAHYEIARGNPDEARRLAAVIEKQANVCGFLPEQVWDSFDIPERGLWSGRPSGSAMPLVWAHAEYVKLLRSLRDNAVFDMPPQPVERYQRNHVTSSYAFWRPEHKICALPQGKLLRVESPKAAKVYWTLDDWKTVECTPTTDSLLGIYYCDLPTSTLPPDACVGFTLWWETDQCWENRAYELCVEERHT